MLTDVAFLMVSFIILRDNFSVQLGAPPMSIIVGFLKSWVLVKPDTTVYDLIKTNLK